MDLWCSLIFILVMVLEYCVYTSQESQDISFWDCLKSCFHALNLLWNIQTEKQLKDTFSLYLIFLSRFLFWMHFLLVIHICGEYWFIKIISLKLEFPKLLFASVEHSYLLTENRTQFSPSPKTVKRYLFTLFNFPI